MTPSDPWVNIWNPDDDYKGTELDLVSRTGDSAKEDDR